MIEEMAAALCAYITAHGPNRTNPQVLDLVSINAGWESDVYAFDLECGPSADRVRLPLILRIYPGDGAADKAAYEHRALTLLAAQGYPVPRVDALEIADSPFGKPFVLMERVPGVLMAHLARDASREAQSGYLRQAIDLLVRLHRLDWRPFVADPAAFESADGLGQVRQTLSRWERLAEPFGISSALAQLAWFSERLADVPPGRPAVIHLDYHGYNILVDADGSTTVIDWTCTEVSDPRVDLAWTLLLYHGDGPAFHDAVVREYERAAGATAEGLDYFYALACWRRVWSVAIALLQGAGAVGMRPGAEETIRRSLPAVGAFYRTLAQATGVSSPEVAALLGA